MNRPEWVKCIKDARAHSNSSYCGKPLSVLGYTFVDTDHAVLCGINGSRLVACKECVAVVTEALKVGHDEY